MADNNSNPSSMGDLFLQRRRQAAAAAASQTPLTSLGSTDYRAADNNNNNNSSANNASASSNRKKSFLEIQQEQEQLQREQQKQNQQPPRSSSQAGGGGHYQQQASSYHRSSSASHQQRSLYNPNASNSSNSSNRREQREQRERDRGRSSSRGLASSNLPIEQGVIHTLLDKFGFILCADRNIELFFHYSEYKSGHSDTLQIGDEVEFRVSEEQKTNKLAALDVRQLPKGTIYWEYEEEEGKVFDGVVELSCSSSVREDGGGGGRRGGGGGKKGGGDGIIRLKKKDDDDDEQQQQPMIDIYYTPSDYKPNNKKQTGAHSSSSSSSRLERKDVIQFSLVTERRTGKKYARNITLIQSERERQRLEREAKLMENATLERGKVVSTKGDFGFLRSASRVEQVYYHVSHVVELTTDDGNDDDDGGRGGSKKATTTIAVAATSCSGVTTNATLTLRERDMTINLLIYRIRECKCSNRSII